MNQSTGLKLLCPSLHTAVPVNAGGERPHHLITPWAQAGVYPILSSMIDEGYSARNTTFNYVYLGCI